MPHANWSRYIVVSYAWLDLPGASGPTYIALRITGIRASFGKHDTDTKLRIHNITFKAALCYGGQQERRPTTGRGANEIPETIIRPYKIGSPEKS